MADIRRVTPAFAVAPQLAPEQLVEAASQGFRLLINNRPDGEAAGQPSSAAMAAAAHAAGMDYVHIPVIGRAQPVQIEAMHEAVSGAAGPVLAFCRSGTRSITLWAQAQVGRGGPPREELLHLGDKAGYNLSGSI